MKEKTEIRNPVYSLLPSDIEEMNSLAKLAPDMRWSWNHAADYTPRIIPNFQGISVPLETDLILWQR